jgi:NAD(P)-dependent dehydrogenase (short-subunit alcohol dehydrogenase family)
MERKQMPCSNDSLETPLPKWLKKFSLEGKVAIITGAGSGLGKGVSKGMALSGASVVLVDINYDSVAAQAGELISEGLVAEPLKADVTKKEEVRSTVEYVSEKYGHIDILANLAGITRRMPLEIFNEDDFDSVINVNLKGTFLFTKYAGAQMLKQDNGGSIINFGSLGSLVAIPESAAYCASKGGVAMLTKTAAVEWASRKVRVNAIIPGTFNTPLLQYCIDENPQYGEAMLQRFPIGRFGDPEEIVGACIYLASDASSYTTGALLVVDGGCVAF